MVEVSNNSDSDTEDELVSWLVDCLDERGAAATKPQSVLSRTEAQAMGDNKGREKSQLQAESEAGSPAQTEAAEPVVSGDIPSTLEVARLEGQRDEEAAATIIQSACRRREAQAIVRRTRAQREIQVEAALQAERKRRLLKRTGIQHKAARLNEERKAEAAEVRLNIRRDSAAFMGQCSLVRSYLR